MEEDVKSKKIGLYIAIIIVCLVLIIGVFIFIKNKKNNDVKPTDNNNQSEVKKPDETGQIEEDDDKPLKTEKTLIFKKDYTFDNKQLVLTFNKLSETYASDDGDIVYSSIVVDIAKDNDVLFENFEVVSYIDEEETEADHKNDANGFISNIGYFKDLNGKKYMLVNTIGTGGGSYSVLDLDNKKTIFSYGHGDMSSFTHKLHSSLEKSLGVDLSKYFKNNRKSLVIDNNKVGYFKLDYEKADLEYIEIQVKDGEVVTKTTVIKSNLTEKQLEATCPDVYSSVEEEAD